MKTEYVAKKQSRETEKEGKKRKNLNTECKAKKRKKETVEEREERNRKEATLRRLRRSQHVPSSQYAARNALKVLSGEQIVPKLKDSESNLGCL